jgi:copper oxidase (laccase) domain-containing protein
MIHVHQPTIFGKNVIARLSSKQDGNMKLGMGEDDAVRRNRRLFLKSAGLRPEDTTLVAITYNTDDFAKYRIATAREKSVGMENSEGIMVADALVVDQPGHALFLPIADCIGAILYDEAHHALMVSHIGRHSAEAGGALKSVDFLVRHYATDPGELKVWLSPAVGKATYPLHAFDGKSLHEVVEAQLIEAGIKMEHIENANVDTAASDDYYSHSQHLKGQDESGRFAIVAAMCGQGEPAS